MAIATVRVRGPSTDPTGRPDREHLEAAASLLAQRGFAVLRIGRFGVNIEADSQLFERELGVQLPIGDSIVAPARPRNVALHNLIDLVEVTGRPISLRSGN